MQKFKIQFSETISRETFEQDKQKISIGKNDDDGKKCDKTLNEISLKVKKKNGKNKDKKLINLDIKSESDLVSLLMADSFSGLDKLQWKIIKKRLKKLLLKVTKNKTCKVDEKMCKKLDKKVKSWISLQ